MKYVIRNNCFTLNIDIIDNTLSTSLLDFAEEVRGNGLLYQINSDYSIYIMSNYFSAIYPNNKNLNIVINGKNKGDDRSIMSVNMSTKDIEKIKTLLIRYASFNKLKIL